MMSNETVKLVARAELPTDCDFVDYLSPSKLYFKPPNPQYMIAKKRTVIFHKKSDFERQMIQLRQSGGPAGKAYQKIGEVRTSVELGVQSASRFTRNGETRIKNCSKYELGDGYRLVTIELGEVVVFCFAGGKPDSMKWLDANKGLVPVISKNHRVSFTYEDKERGIIPAANHPVISNDKLIDAIEGVDLDKLFIRRSLRRQFDKFTFQTDEDDILNLVLRDFQWMVAYLDDSDEPKR